jgi:hypothetical protein
MHGLSQTSLLTTLTPIGLEGKKIPREGRMMGNKLWFWIAITVYLTTAFALYVYVAMKAI